MIIDGSDKPIVYSANHSYERSMAAVKQDDLEKLKSKVCNVIRQAELKGQFKAKISFEVIDAYSDATVEEMKKYFCKFFYSIEKRAYGSSSLIISWEKESQK